MVNCHPEKPPEMWRWGTVPWLWKCSSAEQDCSVEWWGQNGHAPHFLPSPHSSPPAQPILPHPRLSRLNVSHAATRDLGPSSSLATLSSPRAWSEGPGQQVSCVQVLEGEARTQYG